MKIIPRVWRIVISRLIPETISGGRLEVMFEIISAVLILGSIIGSAIFFFYGKLNGFLIVMIKFLNKVFLVKLAQ